MKRIGLCLAIVVLLLSFAAVAQADDGTGNAVASDGYTVSWWTVAGGGSTAGGGNFALSSTSGQSDAGLLTGGDFTLHGGFWFAPLLRPSLYLPVIVRN
jgi:hypothetical protein